MAINKFKCSQNSVISKKNLSPPKCNKCLVITFSHKLISTHHILILRRVIFKMLHLDYIEKEENQCSWWHNKRQLTRDYIILESLLLIPCVFLFTKHFFLLLNICLLWTSSIYLKHMAMTVRYWYDFTNLHLDYHFWFFILNHFTVVYQIYYLVNHRWKILSIQNVLDCLPKSLNFV